MPSDLMADNPMTFYSEPKQIKQPIDTTDLNSLRRAATLLEEVTDEMLTDLKKPFRDELWKVMDSMNARIELMERANSNPFECFDMVRYAEKVCGRR